MDSFDTLQHFAGTQPSTLLAIFGVLVVAYAIFSLMGFGTALFASTPLAWALPVAQVVPLLAMLDGVGAMQRGYRARHEVDIATLRRLLPGMLLGQMLGVGLLAVLPLKLTATLLGGFVMTYGAWSLRAPRLAPPSAKLAWACGGFGGVLGGMFGSGGFVYAAYLQARLPSRDVFRATQAVMISVSTLWRIALCAMSGLIDLRLVATAALLLPAVYLGNAVGHLADSRLSADGFRRGLNALLIASGLALVLKAVG